MSAVSKVLYWLFPKCPQGDHIQTLGIVTNVRGNTFCRHKDCITANLKDVEDYRLKEGAVKDLFLEYTVLESSTKSGLIDLVNKRRDSGWVCIGGVCHDRMMLHGNSYNYDHLESWSQAMSYEGVKQ